MYKRRLYDGGKRFIHCQNLEEVQEMIDKKPCIRQAILGVMVYDKGGWIVCFDLEYLNDSERRGASTFLNKCNVFKGYVDETILYTELFKGREIYAGDILKIETEIHENGKRIYESHSIKLKDWYSPKMFLRDVKRLTKDSSIQIKNFDFEDGYKWRRGGERGQRIFYILFDSNNRRYTIRIDYANKVSGTVLESIDEYMNHILKGDSENERRYVC